MFDSCLLTEEKGDSDWLKGLLSQFLEHLMALRFMQPSDIATLAQFKSLRMKKVLDPSQTLLVN